MAGVVSSVVDLFAWDRALRAGRILPEKTRARMFTPVLSGYAYGWHVSRSKGRGRCVEHPGDVKGFETQFMRFLDRDAVLILLANREDVRWQVGRNLAAILFDEELPVPPVPPFVPWAAGKLREVAGTYSLWEDARLVVRTRPDGVLVGAEGQAAVDLLRPAGGREVTPRSYAREQKLAREVLEGIVRGDVSKLAEMCRPAWYADSWARQVKTHLWPGQLKNWGAWRSHVILGIRPGVNAGRIEVLGRFRHERGQPGFTMTFEKGRLAGFSFDGPEFPATALFLPVSGSRLETYDFGRRTAPAVSLVEDGNGKVTGLRLHLAGEEFIARRGG
jgi:hypothetical protein